MKRFDQQLRKEVTILGANGFFGKVISLLLKQSPAVNILNLFDYENVETGNDLKLIKSKCRIRSYSGKEKIAEAIKSADVVLISDYAAPGSSFYNPHTEFLHKAKKITKYAAQIAACNSSSIIIVATSPINFSLPLVNEILERLGKLDTSKVIGMTNVEVIRANSLFASHLHVNPRSVWLPVVGGSSQETRVPLFSKAKPALTYNLRKLQKITSEIKTFDIQVYGIKRESELLNRAYATAQLVNAVLAGLEGKDRIIETVMSQQEVEKETRFISLPVQLGKEGIQRRIPLPRVSNYEAHLLEHAMKSLASDANKAIDYVNNNVNIEKLKLNSRVSQLSELEKSQGSLKEMKKSAPISMPQEKMPLNIKLETMHLETEEENPEPIISLSYDAAKKTLPLPKLDFIDESIPFKYLAHKNKESSIFSSKKDRKIKLTNKSNANSMTIPSSQSESKVGQIPPQPAKSMESSPLFIYHNKEDSNLNSAINHFDKNRIKSEEVTLPRGLDFVPESREKTKNESVSSCEILSQENTDISINENSPRSVQEEGTNIHTSDPPIPENKKLLSNKEYENSDLDKASKNGGTDVSLHNVNSTVTKDDVTNATYKPEEGKLSCSDEEKTLLSSLQQNSANTEDKGMNSEHKAVDSIPYPRSKENDKNIENGNHSNCQSFHLDRAEDIKCCQSIPLNSKAFNLYSSEQNILRWDLLKKLEGKITCFTVLGSSRHMSSKPLSNEEEDISSNVDKKKYKPRADEILKFFKEKRNLAVQDQSSPKEEPTLLKRNNKLKFSPQLKFAINDECNLTKKLLEKQKKLITSVKNNDVLFDKEKAEKPVSKNVAPNKIIKFKKNCSRIAEKSTKINLNLNNKPKIDQSSSQLKHVDVTNVIKQIKEKVIETRINSEKKQISMESEPLTSVTKSCQVDNVNTALIIKNNQSHPVVDPDSSSSKNIDNNIETVRGNIGREHPKNSPNYEIGNSNKEASPLNSNSKFKTNNNLPALMTSINNENKSGENVPNDNREDIQKESNSSSEKALAIVSVCPSSCGLSKIKC